MTGQVVHFEVPVDDVERASAFYQQAFGWELAAMPEMNYTMVTTAPSGPDGRPTAPGTINGGMMVRDAQVTAPVITINVDEMDLALARVEQLGGKILVGRQAVGDMGFAAYFQDTEGNVMGLWQTALSDDAPASQRG